MQSELFINLTIRKKTSIFASISYKQVVNHKVDRLLTGIKPTKSLMLWMDAKPPSLPT